MELVTGQRLRDSSGPPPPLNATPSDPRDDVPVPDELRGNERKEGSE
jgi:hypothetical protein